MRIVLLLSLLSVLVLRSSEAEIPDISLLERLASPELEGRGLGTEGIAKARELLRERLAAAGIPPAFAGSYLQPFRVFIGNELLPGNSFAGEAAPHFIPLAFSRSGLLEGRPLVFAGFGISLRPQEGAPAGYDDYAGLEVQGRIVIVMAGDPGTGNRDSVFRNPAFHSYSTVMYKVKNAELHGAAGVVLVRDPLSLSGQEPALRFQPRQGGGATVGVLAGQASIRHVESLLGQPLLALQERIAREQRPQSFAVDRQASLQVALERQLGSAENVAAWIPGTEPSLAGEFLVVGAHYDHLGFGGDSSLDPEGIGKAHLGADDNASGVQAAFDLALRVWRSGGGRRPLLLVLFSAEEVGLLGSRQFVESPPLPEGARIVGMINLDMVGRLSGNRVSVLAAKSGFGLPELVEEANRETALTLAGGDSGSGSSDHASFLRAKIPSVFFTTGAHGDYHRPSDSFEKINAAGLAQVTELAFRTWRALDGLAGPPVWNPAAESPDEPPRDRGYGAYFGSIPDFEQGEIEGVKLQGVRPDSPAALAGLRGGDLLQGLGEIRVRNLQDLVFALRFYRPNEEVEVQWLRDGIRMRARAVLRDRNQPK